MASAGQDSMDKASQPTLCTNGCGFYSNAGTGGLCSKCHRDAAKKAEMSKQALIPPPQQQQAPPAQPSAAVPELLASASAAAAAAAAPVVAPAVDAPAAGPSSPSSPATAPAAPAAPAPKPPSPTRCLTCNKKVGLTGFNCKCQPDAVFCSTHRYAEAHACTFDWKGSQRAVLAANNPVVQASKLQKL